MYLLNKDFTIKRVIYKPNKNLVNKKSNEKIKLFKKIR